MSNAILLKAIGYDVTFVGITKSSKKQERLFNGFRSIALPYPRTIREWLHYVFAFTDRSTIVNNAPNYVILYNFPAIASLRVLHYCHQNNIKVISDLTEWEQTDGFSIRDIIKRIDTQMRMLYCSKKMDGVIAISRFLYDFYKNFTNTILVPPTVDITDEKWHRTRKLSCGQRPRLVYAGSAGPNKDRLDYIVDVLQEFENIDLYIIGTNENQFKNNFGFYPPAKGNIYFLGELPHRETLKYVCDSDFQIIIRDNNRKTKAGFPTKFVESMSCCTPVIATLSSNIGDYLYDGINGFVIDENRTFKCVLNKITSMPGEEIMKMKMACKIIESFDYRYYRCEFESMFIKN